MAAGFFQSNFRALRFPRFLEGRRQMEVITWVGRSASHCLFKASDRLVRFTLLQVYRPLRVEQARLSSCDQHGPFD
jgi:hypothetical protein